MSFQIHHNDLGSTCSCRRCLRYNVTVLIQNTRGKYSELDVLVRSEDDSSTVEKTTDQKHSFLSPDKKNETFQGVVRTNSFLC